MIKWYVVASSKWNYILNRGRPIYIFACGTITKNTNKIRMKELLYALMEGSKEEKVIAG